MNYFISIFLCIFLTFDASAFANSTEGKKTIIFIVNPISHELKGYDIQECIQKNLDPQQFDYSIVYTEHALHATELAREALANSIDIVVAVGGDGTVNEVGTALINTDAALAIIPVGSGNGLAKHLRIPVGLIPALQALNHMHPMVIDTAKINDKVFLAAAGMGFDAHVAHQFAVLGKRGLLSYCQVAMSEYSNYEAQSYHITVDGKELDRKAFILTIANGSQYGNDFIIAPKACINDGYLDLVMIKNIPSYMLPYSIYQFKHGTLDSSRYYESRRFKELTIKHTTIQAHADGEPLTFHDEIKVSVQPLSLKVLVP